MTFETTYSRRSRRNGKEKLTYGAFLGCFIAIFIFCTVLKPYLRPVPVFPNAEIIMKPMIYNLSNSNSDVYELRGDIRFHGNTSTIFIVSNANEKIMMTRTNLVVKPYPRKKDPAALKNVREFKTKFDGPDKIPRCSQTFNMPAIIFSAGGHAGNYYHAITDVLIPLFFTSRQFNKDVVFLVTNYVPEWISKYKIILESLSKYDIYNIDEVENNDEVLCFPKVIVGLKREPAPFYSSMTNFTQFLRTVYSLEDGQKTSAAPVDSRTSRPPRMLIISRGEGRHLNNEAELVDMAQTLGFEVVAEKFTTNMTLTAQRVSYFDVMVGVHGAGLTNMIFLHENSVVIQIVPFGLGYIAETCFKAPAISMNLKYIEYKIDLNESSLIQRYRHNPEVYNDPVSVLVNKGFGGFSSIYLDHQDVNLDLGRFRETIVKASKFLDHHPF